MKRKRKERKKCNCKKETLIIISNSNDTSKEKVGTRVKKYFEIASYIVVVVTFILSVFPNLNFLSSNYEEKAKAGHAYSQVYLAHHYYEIGNYEESLYWYKLAAEKGKYQAVASNNLAILYSLTEVFRVESTVEDFDKQKFECLVKSALLGNEIGISNLCLFLEKRHFDYYDLGLEDRREIEEIVKEFRGVSDISELMPQYEYKGFVQTKNEFLYGTDTTVYTLQSTSRVLSEDGKSVDTYRTYEVYEQDIDIEYIDLQYDYSVSDFK